MSQQTSEPIGTPGASPKPAVEISKSRGCRRWFVSEGRLRSGWRVLLYIIVARLGDLVGQAAIGVVLAITIALPLERAGMPISQITSRLFGMFQRPLDNPMLTADFYGTRLALTMAIIWVFRRFVDRRSFRSLGFQLGNKWWLEAVAGFFFVIAAWAFIFGVSLVVGAATITGLEATRKGVEGVLFAVGLGLALNIVVGITEESDARGYILQNLAEGIRFWPAVAVSSMYFGVLHLLNPGASLASTLGIFFAGVLLATGYYATGRLWFSIGMHTAWNFAEGPLFGFLVSGLDMGGLFQLKITGPDWLMGGGFGPEAGLLAIAAEIVMIIVLYLWGRGRQHVVGAQAAASNAI